MKIKQQESYWGFNHEQVLKKYNGARFVGEFCVPPHTNIPVAVYFSENPDLSKGHKDYFYLFYYGSLKTNDLKIYVNGLTSEEMERHRHQSGIHCKKCDDVLFSTYRHDFHYCTCKAVAVDGGRDYLRTLGRPENMEGVTIDLLTMEATVLPPIKKKIGKILKWIRDLKNWAKNK